MGTQITPGQWSTTKIANDYGKPLVSQCDVHTFAAEVGFDYDNELDVVSFGGASVRCRAVNPCKTQVEDSPWINIPKHGYSYYDWDKLMTEWDRFGTMTRIIAQAAKGHPVACSNDGTSHHFVVVEPDDANELSILAAMKLSSNYLEYQRQFVKEGASAFVSSIYKVARQELATQRARNGAKYERLPEAEVAKFNNWAIMMASNRFANSKELSREWKKQLHIEIERLLTIDKGSSWFGRMGKITISQYKPIVEEAYRNCRRNYMVARGVRVGHNA